MDQDEKQRILDESYAHLTRRVEPYVPAPVTWRVPEEPEPSLRPPKLDTRMIDEVQLRTHLDAERRLIISAIGDALCEMGVNSGLAKDIEALRAELKTMRAEVEQVKKFSGDVLTAVISGRRE